MGLVLRVEGDPPRIFETEAEASIGRAEENDLVLADAGRTISKQHCAVVLRDGGFRLRDLSRNGTFVNDMAEPVGPEAAVPLAAGDVIRLGDLRITVLAASAAAPLPQADPLSGWDEAAAVPLLAPEEPSDFFPVAAPEVEPPAAFPDHLPAEAGLFIQPRGSGEAIPDDWDLVGELQGLPPGSPMPMPTPSPASQTPLPDSKDSAEQEADALLAAFLTGCGLSAPPPGEDPAALLQRAGRLLRLAVTELHGLLAVRSLAKQEFGLQRTMIGQSDNNPLKFAAEAQEALPLLLAGDIPGFLGGEAALRQGFDDLRAHQLALLAGSQALFARLCERLAPEGIAAAPPRWARPLPFARDAALWAAYRQRYRQVVPALEAEMRAGFGGGPEAGHGG